MIQKVDNQMNFLLEMSELQITAREFFATVLDALTRNFDSEKVLVSYYDTHGKFLSWIDWNGALIDNENHPYRKFAPLDVIRHMIYEDAVRDHLTYFNVTPKLYKSTDIINPVDYDRSLHVRFLEETFHAHYCVTMAFGINAYIQVSFFRNFEEGDFTDENMLELNKIYVYIANAYKNFKKHEQAKIVSKIQNEIIASNEKAYLITDSFLHVMGSNKTAQTYLTDILGASIPAEFDRFVPCSWLSMLMGNESEIMPDQVQTHVIKNYTFKVHTYDQHYSNGIVDRYHWITISHNNPETDAPLKRNLLLTPTEQKVAELMHNGLTYQAIADEMMISIHTVKKHVQNIYTKCGVKSRFQLYKWLEDKKQ